MPEIKFQEQDEASSTERLLNTIRGADSNGFVSGIADNLSSESREKRVAGLLGKNSPHKKRTVNVGVALGGDRAFIVVISPNGNKKWEVLDCRELLFENGLTVNDSNFPAFLGRALKKFVGGYKKARIWSLIPSVDVEIRHIKIPRVARDKIADAVYWTFKKDSKFDDNLYVFDYEIIGDIIDNGVEKTEVIAYTAPEKEIESRKKLFIAAGFALTGMNVVALAFQNYLRIFQDGKDRKNSCMLFIGRDWARIDIYTDGFLTLSRDIKTGYMSMVEAITDATNRSPAVFPDENVTGLQDIRYISAEEIEKNFIADLYKRVSSRELEKVLGADEKQIREMVMPVIDRLAKQIDRTLEFFASNYNKFPVEKIYVSGLPCGSERIMKIFAAQVSHPVVPFDPFGAGSPIECGVELPELMAIRDQFSPALCMALFQDAEKFNFLNTQKDKAEKKYLRKVNYTVVLAFISIMALCGGYYAWQHHELSLREKELAGLNTKLATYFHLVDKDTVSALAAKVARGETRLKRYIQTYSPLALICEITKLTPQSVYLERFSIKASGTEKKSAGNKIILIEGFVLEEELTRESTLAKFILNLSDSPLIKNASVKDKSFDTMGGERILRFTASAGGN